MGLDFLLAESAAAEPLWYHPFATYAPMVSGYGPRTPPCPECSSFHRGLDFAGGSASENFPIYAVAAGTVVSYTNSAFGPNVVLVQHADNWRSLYGHMNLKTVTPGQAIGVSELVGYVGRLGNVTGPHLHLELHYNGVPQDPTNKVLYPAPLANSAPPPVPPQYEEIDMIQIRIWDSENRFGGGVMYYFAYVGGGLKWAPYTDQRQANAFAVYVQRPTAVVCTYEDWDYYMKLMGGTNPIAAS